ncbi:MAG: hypothetical protein AAGA75_27395 [Cyanobacteria bacterium P01_E01_bin.6]
MVAVSLVIFLASLLPTIQELNRAVRGAEHLIETLNRELPTTLDALRSTSRELNHLTEDLGDGVESAKQIVQQVDRGLEETEKQLVQARITSQSAIAGAKAAWNAFFQVDRNRAKQPTSSSTDHVSSQLRKQPNANTLHVDENSHDHRTASKKSQL